MLLKVDKSLRYNLTPERLNIGRPNQLCVHVYLSQPKRKGMKKKAPPQKTTADVWKDTRSQRLSFFVMHVYKFA